eukprot:293811-Chlamydomonas_euryale.AAC.10
MLVVARQRRDAAKKVIAADGCGQLHAMCQDSATSRVSQARSSGTADPCMLPTHQLPMRSWAPGRGGARAPCRLLHTTERRHTSVGHLAHSQLVCGHCLPQAQQLVGAPRRCAPHNALRPAVFPPPAERPPCPALGCVRGCGVHPRRMS